MLFVSNTILPSLSKNSCSNAFNGSLLRVPVSSIAIADADVDADVAAVVAVAAVAAVVSVVAVVAAVSGAGITDSDATDVVSGDVDPFLIGFATKIANRTGL